MELVFFNLPKIFKKKKQKMFKIFHKYSYGNHFFEKKNQFS